MVPNTIQAKAEALPERIFRYLPPKRIDCLVHERVCFNPPSRFNDPFDLMPVIRTVTDRVFFEARAEEYAVKEVSEQWPDLPAGQKRRFIKKRKMEIAEIYQNHPETFTELLRKDFVATINRTQGALCFSATHESLLMWAHYAENHEGFVVGFDTEDLQHQLGDPLKVDYDTPQRPELDPTQEPTFWPFLRKSREWEYEQEYRIFRPLELCCEPPSIVEGSEVHFVKLRRSLVKVVFLGCRIKEPTRERIKNLMKSSSAEIYQADLHKTEFGLVFTRIQ